MKEALKSLPKSQQYIIDIKSFNVYTFSLKTHLFDILNSEEEVKKELMSVNAAHQQPNKIAS